MGWLQKLRWMLFGTDYVAIQWGFSYEVQPVRTSPNGRRLVHLYGGAHFLDAAASRSREFIELTRKVSP